jgi:hypothetical protein
MRSTAERQAPRCSSRAVRRSVSAARRRDQRCTSTSAINAPTARAVGKRAISSRSRAASFSAGLASSGTSAATATPSAVAHTSPRTTETRLMRNAVTGRTLSAGEVCGQGSVSDTLGACRGGLVLVRPDLLSLANAVPFFLAPRRCVCCACDIFAQV